jgi:hypothetical protein
MALVKCKECGTEVSSKAAACPKCGANPPKSRSVIKIVGGTLLVLFVLSAFMHEGDGTPGAGASADAADPAPLPFETTAREIAAAYSENTVAADNQYKDQRFTVTGVISDINTDFTGTPVVILVGGQNPFLEPQAELIESDKQKAAGLKKGQTITLLCTGKGDIAKTPMMDECSIAL